LSKNFFLNLSKPICFRSFFFSREKSIFEHEKYEFLLSHVMSNVKFSFERKTAAERKMGFHYLAKVAGKSFMFFNEILLKEQRKIPYHLHKERILNPTEIFSSFEIFEILKH